MTRRIEAALDFIASASPSRPDRMREPAMLYYLRIDSPHGLLYKIGIAQRGLLDRYPPADRQNITVLRVWRFKLGKWAKAKERQILLHGLDDRYHGPPVLKSGGDSELFVRDILGLDVDNPGP